MAFTYSNKSPDWVSTGTEPSHDYKLAGFQAGRGLPAPYLNWLMTQISTCITELQNKSVGVTGTGGNASAVFNSDANTASGLASSAFGFNSVAKNFQTTVGKFNTEYDGPTSSADATGTIFTVGVGTSSTAKANAFRVTAAGQCMGTTYFASSGADYAELWEIKDKSKSKEDLRGLFVTVDENNKISIANADDYILGIVSANPSSIGNAHTENWKDMYLKDVYGDRLTETVEVEETTDEEGNVIPAHTETRFIINPEYDADKEYKSRLERPEWATVGLLGQIIARQDGTCKAGGLCKVADGGIATASENGNGWKVLEVIDESHIKVMYK